MMIRTITFFENQFFNSYKKSHFERFGVGFFFIVFQKRIT